MRKTTISRLVPIAAVGLVVGLGAFARSLPAAAAKNLNVVWYEGGACSPATCYAYAEGVALDFSKVCGKDTAVLAAGTTVSASCNDTLAGIWVGVYDSVWPPNWNNANGCRSSVVAWNAPWGTSCSASGGQGTGYTWVSQ